MCIYVYTYISNCVTYVKFVFLYILHAKISGSEVCIVEQ